TFRPAGVQAIVGQYLAGGRANAEPALVDRRLRPVGIQTLQAEARGRLADHDHRAVAVQLKQQAALLGCFRQRLDIQQGHTAAENAVLGQLRRQGGAIIRWARQEQTPAGHGWPASPYTSARMAAAPCCSSASATSTPSASAF